MFWLGKTLPVLSLAIAWYLKAWGTCEKQLAVDSRQQAIIDTATIAALLNKRPVLDKKEIQQGRD